MSIAEKVKRYTAVLSSLTSASFLNWGEAESCQFKPISNLSRMFNRRTIYNPFTSAGVSMCPQGRAMWMGVRRG